MNKSNFIIGIMVLMCAITFQVYGQNQAQDLISRYKIEFGEPPSKIPIQHSVDAPMLGNGFMGVAISGAPEKQVYYLARNDFWRLKSSLRQGYPAVLGKLEINIPGLKDGTYLIEQDIYSAETHSYFSKSSHKVHFKTYVSANEDLLVIEIEMEGGGELEGAIDLQLPGDLESAHKPPIDIVYEAETGMGITKDGISYILRGFKKDVDIPTEAFAAAKIYGGDSNKFVLSSKEKIVIGVSLSSNFKSTNGLRDVKERLSSLSITSFDKVETEHKKWWEKFWGQSYVNINEPTIERQYYLSNYSMASFSRDKDFPPSIFGTCITKEVPSWNGDYHLNYNHYAPYYGLFSSNHVEQAIPCNIAMLAQQERGEYYSEKVTGIKGGILLPVGAGPLGIETTRRNEFMETHRDNWIEDGSVQDEGLFYGQKSNSSYAIANMAMHFYTTYDEEYTALYYPFVKAVATFWEEYLTWENGRYVIYNDAIHEGTIGTLNPILSLGLVRMVMNTAIDMSNELGINQDRIEKWQHILDHLSDYTYQEREGLKVFRYSEKGTKWWVNNTLGIQHIYPGGQIGLDSDEDLLKVAHNTIHVMQRWIDFNGSNSFFPAAVRVGYNPDTILTQLNKYSLHTKPNGFQFKNPHGIENMSTVPNTVNEMLCMGHGGIVRVFPVWPKNKDASFYNLRTYGAFLVSSELKDGVVESIEVFSERGRVLNLLNPWEGKSVTVIRPDGKEEIYEGERIEIITSEGEKLVIRPSS